ncbi:hypothetical protein B4135_1599 [Caldibacillus debilis]|uniref:Uncharacterized protein n=1 Tax=Caldibacillus debilis TaxID=301148 RepID=A0A150MBQ4_9BACI|nr:hypothetical protein B4135_1599 [Caldibacillus debilis]
MDHGGSACTGDCAAPLARLSGRIVPCLNNFEQERPRSFLPGRNVRHLSFLRGRMARHPG